MAQTRHAYYSDTETRAVIRSLDGSDRTLALHGRISPAKLEDMACTGSDEGIESLRYIVSRYTITGELFKRVAGNPYRVDSEEVIKNGKEVESAGEEGSEASEGAEA